MWSSWGCTDKTLEKLWTFWKPEFRECKSRNITRALSMAVHVKRTGCRVAGFISTTSCFIWGYRRLALASAGRKRLAVHVKSISFSWWSKLVCAHVCEEQATNSSAQQKSIFLWSENSIKGPDLSSVFFFLQLFLQKGLNTSDQVGNQAGHNKNMSRFESTDPSWLLKKLQLWLFKVNNMNLCRKRRKSTVWLWLK